MLLLVFLLDPLQELCCPLVPRRTSEGRDPAVTRCVWEPLRLHLTLMPLSLAKRERYLFTERPSHVITPAIDTS